MFSLGTKEIGIKLKELRKRNGFSVNEIANKLKEYDCEFSPKTVYGWENGHTQPDADVLIALCDIYNVDDIINEFGTKKRKTRLVNLTEKEEEYIKKIRELQDSRKEMIYGVIDEVYEEKDYEIEVDDQGEEQPKRSS